MAQAGDRARAKDRREELAERVRAVEGHPQSGYPRAAHAMLQCVPRSEGGCPLGTAKVQKTQFLTKIAHKGQAGSIAS